MAKDTWLNLLAHFKKSKQIIADEIGKAIVGQTDVIDQMLAAIFSRGHCLLVGVPGLAKTLLISTLAEILDLDFNRIQFTPDLMPSDITGTCATSFCMFRICRSFSTVPRSGDCPVVVRARIRCSSDRSG